MIPFEQYTKIYNNYGICYFGYADEYLLLLKLVRPYLENAFPNLNIYLISRDESYHFIKDIDKTLKISELKSKRSEFAHVREIQYGNNGHPIFNLIKEANISPPSFYHNTEPTEKCCILTKSVYPTKDLNQDQIEEAKKYARKLGFIPELDVDPINCGLVIGVESSGLVQSLIKGQKTILIPTGVGENLFKKMFPYLEILDWLSHR